MAQLMQAFDARQHDPSQLASQLPLGDHLVIAYQSEIKPTKDSGGGYLQYDLRIIEGPNAGATGPKRFNLYNGSQKAVEIAHRELSAMAHACGVYQITDSAQLHDIPFRVRVELQKGEAGTKNGYTEVTRIFDRNGNEPGAGQHQQQQQQQPQNNGGFNVASGAGTGFGGGQQQQQQQQQPPQGNAGGNGGSWGAQNPGNNGGAAGGGQQPANWGAGNANQNTAGGGGGNWGAGVQNGNGQQPGTWGQR
jgi:hypothetical protein